MHATTRFTQRALLWALTLTLALGVAGCSAETRERKAFIDFLQTRIIDKAGVHVPRLTAEEEKSFGIYQPHFAVISDFNTSLDTKVAKPMTSVLQKGMPRTIAEIVERKADLAKLRETSALLRTTVAQELAKADGQHARLKQPADLKAVYDKAYTRTVTNPANMVKEVMPSLEETLASAEKFATFLAAHKSEITIRGSMMEVNNPTLLAEANALMEEVNQKGKVLAAAQKKMNALMTGR